MTERPMVRALHGGSDGPEDALLTFIYIETHFTSIIMIIKFSAIEY